MKKEMSAQKKATVVSSSVATILLIVKLTIGIASRVQWQYLPLLLIHCLIWRSHFLTSLLLKNLKRKPNEYYQYGKGKIQAIAAVIEGTVITDLRTLHYICCY